MIQWLPMRYPVFPVALAALLAGCESPRPVGIVSGLSGPTGALGTSERDGARMFVESRGRRIIPCDSRVDPASTARCVRELADSGVRVVLGPMYSVEAESALAAAAQVGVLLVSPSVMSSAFVGRNDLMIRVAGSNLDEADTLASLLVRLGSKRPLVAWARLNAPYTEPMANRIAEVLKTRNGIIVATVGYRTSVDIDFDSLLSMHPGADGYVLLGTSAEIALMARAVRKRDAASPILGCQSALDGDLMRIGGKDAEGVIVSGATDLIDLNPSRRRFSEEFQARFGRERTWASTLGWEAAAISEVAWDAPDALEGRRRILAQEPLAPLGVRLVLDRFGDVKRPIVVYAVRGGRLEPFRLPGGGRGGGR